MNTEAQLFFRINTKIPQPTIIRRIGGVMPVYEQMAVVANSNGERFKRSLR